MFSALFFFFISFLSISTFPISVSYGTKTLSHDASDREYALFVKNLRQGGLTVKQFMRERLDKQYKKIIKAIQKKWDLSDKELWHVRRLQQEVREYDQEHFSPDTQIEYSKWMQKHVREMIAKLCNRFKIYAPVCVDYDSGYGSEACVYRTIDAPEGFVMLRKDSFQPCSLEYGFHSVSLGILFKASTPQEQYAILLHELGGHVHLGHNTERYFLINLIVNKQHNEQPKKKSWFSWLKRGDVALLSTDEIYASYEWKALMLQHEYEADIIPALETIEHARAFEALFSTWYEAGETNDEDHPPVQERFEMAVMIRKLLEVEAHIS